MTETLAEMCTVELDENKEVIIRKGGKSCRPVIVNDVFFVSISAAERGCNVNSGTFYAAIVKRGEPSFKTFGFRFPGTIQTQDYLRRMKPTDSFLVLTEAPVAEPQSVPEPVIAPSGTPPSDPIQEWRDSTIALRQALVTEKRHILNRLKAIEIGLAELPTFEDTENETDL